MTPRSKASSPRQRLLKMLAEDQTWLKYRRIAKNSWPVEFDGFEQEIVDIHKARPIRLITTTSSLTGKTLGNAVMCDQSYRSRAVEIAMSVYRVKCHLELTRALTKKHIAANYSQYMNDWGLRGIRERETVVASLFHRADELISRYEMLMELSDWVIADVDAGGFATQKTLKAIEVATKRELM